MASIGVVIPVKNGYPEIKYCIESLQGQTIKPLHYYIIDSGSTDETINYLNTIPEVKLIAINPTTFNHGETRNLGWKYSTEEFLFYTVQDAQAADIFLLEKLLQCFNDPNVMGVCGRQIVPHESDKNPLEWYRPISVAKSTRYEFKNAFVFEALPPEDKKNICSWDDVVALYRRKALEIIPFRKVVFGEDMLWANDVLRQGYAIVYNPLAQVHHYHHETSDFTFKRALTTIYFRYKNFGYLPSLPKVSIRKEISNLKHIIALSGFNPLSWAYWYIYNRKQHNAIKKAYKIFFHHLKESEQALDEIHERYCAIAPMAKRKV